MGRWLCTFCALAAVLLPAGRVAGQQQPPAASGTALETVYNSIEDFVREDYLSSWFASPQLIRRHFADPLDYYWGKEKVPLADVLRDKIAYVTRWPQRYYRLVDDSLRVARTGIGPETYTVTFQYEWETKRIGDARAGLGETDLIVQFDGADITIRGENGRVLERYETGTQAPATAGATRAVERAGAN